MSRSTQDLGFLRAPLQLTKSTGEDLDELGAEWWDYNALNPNLVKKKLEDIGQLNLPRQVMRDMMTDGTNPQQLIKEYRYVNDAPNLLTDPNFLKYRWGTTEFPTDQVALVQQAGASWAEEKERYTSLFPKEKETDAVSREIQAMLMEQKRRAARNRIEGDDRGDGGDGGGGGGGGPVLGIPLRLFGSGRDDPDASESEDSMFGDLFGRDGDGDGDGHDDYRMGEGGGDI